MVYLGKLYTELLPKLFLMFLQTGVPCKWTRDSKHFILENFDLIKDSPSQIYSSALTLCPSLSWLHEYYTADVKVVVGSVEWGTCIRTISHEDHTWALAYWNNTIATGFTNCQGHSHPKLSVAQGAGSKPSADEIQPTARRYPTTGNTPVWFPGH